MSFTTILVVVGISVVTVAGDYFIKLSGNKSEKFMDIGSFLFGLLFYVLSAFGWFFIMKHVKLSTIGITYGIMTAALLAIVGLVIFKESLNFYEILGLFLGIFSLILLGRFTQ
jgi:multidrug transporter EmrE-like cation transporter